MRGGTSRGPFFDAADLPADIAPRDRVLLAVMGSPDKRQIDGLGGAHPLTSKVGIVRRGSSRASTSISCSPSCSRTRTPSTPRRTAATCSRRWCPSRWKPAWSSRRATASTLRVLTLNTDMQCDITVQTPERPRRVRGRRPASTACPERRRRSRSTSSIPRARSAPGLLPTGHVRDVIDGVAVTCIDNGMPLVMFSAADVGRTGYEGVDAAQRRRRAEGAHRAAAHRLRPRDGPRRRDREELPEDDADRAAARRRQPLHAQLHPACLPRRDRRARRGDGRHRLRARGLGLRGRRGGAGRQRARTFRSSTRRASSASSSRSIRPTRRTSPGPRCCAPRGC